MRNIVSGLTGLTLAFSLTLPALAVQDTGAAEDPNLRQPGLYTVEQDGTTVQFVVGDGAWGDVLASISALREAPAEQQPVLAERLWEARNEYPPALLFEVARIEATRNPQRAMDAYYLGRLRTMYDASRCIDSSALGVIETVSAYAGETVIDLMLTQPQLMQTTLANLSSSDEVFAGQASPWWACSFGDMAYYAAANNAPMPGAEWLKLESRWPAIQNDLRVVMMDNYNRLSESLAEAGAQ